MCYPDRAEASLRTRIATCVILIELRQGPSFRTRLTTWYSDRVQAGPLISYQAHHMLLLAPAGRPDDRGPPRRPVPSPPQYKRVLEYLSR